MAVVSKTVSFSTKGNGEIVDITSEVSKILKVQSIVNGIVNISVVGSTGALTTCEYEPGLVEDLKNFFDKIIPQGSYHHDRVWGDGNGHSHLRSSLLGSSVTFPFNDKEMILGTWQQIIFIDFDNRSRTRKIVVQIVGE